MDATADVEVQLEQGDVALTARDRTLLQAVAAHGSLNAAADALGRSYAHAQRRIVELEDAFGPLVDRVEVAVVAAAVNSRTLLSNYWPGFSGSGRFRRGATTDETVLRGTVEDRTGNSRPS